MGTRQTTEPQERALDQFMSDIWGWTGAVVDLGDLVVETQIDGSIRAVWVASDRMAVGHFEQDGSGSSGWGRVEIMHHSALDPCHCRDCGRKKKDAETA